MYTAFASKQAEAPEMDRIPLCSGMQAPVPSSAVLCVFGGNGTHSCDTEATCLWSEMAMSAPRLLQCAPIHCLTQDTPGQAAALPQGCLYAQTLPSCLCHANGLMAKQSLITDLEL